MLVNEILVEYREADLYHGTSLQKAEDIIMSNTLTATRPMELGKGMSPQEQMTVSFSRSFSVAARFAHFKSQTYSNDDLTGVVFVFDQAAIHRDYGRRLQAYNDLQYMSRKSASEAEEALVGPLSNMSKYLKKFYILAPAEQIEALQEIFKVLFNHPKAVIIADKKRKPHGAAYPTHREIER